MSNYLTWDDEVLTSRAFLPRDLRPLLSMQFRGRNVTMPSAVGQRPYAPVLDQNDVTIEWVCTGLVDEDGAPNADAVKGLSENLAYYRALFTGSGESGTGEVDVVLHLPDGDFESTVQCWSWDEVHIPPFSARVLTRLVVPSGTWTLVEEEP